MTLKVIDNIDFEKGNGLVPVIVQDSESKDVLTLAYTCLLYTSPSPRD